MARQNSKKQSRNRYSEDYKAEALKLAERVGVGAAAKQLGRHESQLYSWRNKATRANQSRGDAEQALMAENARLKRELAEQAEELLILKKAAAYFAKHQK